jgi:predicted amidohydrolase
MRDLTVTLIQTELKWESPAENRAHFERLIRAQAVLGDVVVLPEMFTTGFSMNALANAEPAGGATYTWLQTLASELDVALTGSVAIEEDGVVYNRLLFATPDAVVHYDKRHLFRMAGEHKRYAPGSDRVIVNWRDWRIKLEVCYDLRFPVFSRNCGDYDALLYVANWPAPRAQHWRSLLVARAIENLACVIGVNRIGNDANGLMYSGDSLVVNASGELLLDLQNREEVATVSMSGNQLLNWREQFPAHQDADKFSLEL